MRKKNKIRERYRKSGKKKRRKVSFIGKEPGKRKKVKRFKRSSRDNKRHREKSCYGSLEFSSKSILCKRCKWYEDCGEVVIKYPKQKINLCSNIIQWM